VSRTVGGGADGSARPREGRSTGSRENRSGAEWTLDVCDDCLGRTWLLGRLTGHLDLVRSRIGEVLELADEPLIEAVAGRQARRVGEELGEFRAPEARGALEAAGVQAACRCSATYPPALRDLAAPPAILHWAGGGEPAAILPWAEGADPAARVPAVALVGARRCGPYGLDAAAGLGRALAAAGVVIVSGLALGIDSAAHEGALAAGGRTVAVLPCAPQRPYPASRRNLHRRMLVTGLAVSELGPGVAVRRWMFPARNRIIAALADLTVVVAAGERSGALVTAQAARELGRPVGAVPGPIGSPLSHGPHELLRRGARLVTGAEDVLDVLLGSDREAVGAAAGPRGGSAPRPGLDPELDGLLRAIAAGHSVGDAFAAAGLDAARGLAALAALELVGYVRRQPGGRYVATVRGG
jgi:DNA processing protein